MHFFSRASTLNFILIGMTFMSGCMPTTYTKPSYVSPEELADVAPEPIEDNSGLYMFPYTSDEVLAEWVDKSINAKVGEAIGGTAGGLAGQQVLENVPFVGGLIGQEAGKSLGQEIAIKAAGGEEFIKQTSDLSFNRLEDLAVYMYVNYSNNKHYADALEAAQAIYPDLATNYNAYIQNAAYKSK